MSSTGFGTSATIRSRSPSRSPPDASTGAFPSSLTTTVFSQRSMRRLEASLRRATPKGHKTFISRTAPHQGLTPTSKPSLRSGHTSAPTGFSSIYARPDYQSALQKNRARGVPDVAYNAGVAGGVLIFSATINVAFGLPPNAPVFFIIGGTSAGSPQWAGLAADADQLGQRRMGNINPPPDSIGQAKR